MSDVLPLHDLIVPKPQPRLTPSLVPAFRDHAAEMVETYIFTETIRGYFDTIFDSVARGHGQGFWIQAEYGAGKTHFLVALAALLADTSESLWQHVQDAAIRQMQRQVRNTRLFPVLLSLRGEGAGDALVGRTLLDVLLEEGFRRALEVAGLDDQIQVTAVDDILHWFDQTAGAAIQADALAFVQQRTGQSIEAYRDHEGSTALAQVLRDYFDHVGIRPDIAVGVRERLGHLYRQVTDPAGPGYTGVLIVIDEYEGWQKAHMTETELSRDAELLETLGFLLPGDMNYQVYTIVASQSRVPAKLLGHQEGDRFIPLPLLASSSEHDYDIIISRRARDLNQNRWPEIRDYYTYYARQFAFARNLSDTAFFDIFPFQPRCFEAVRRITARDLPTARSGLLVFWQVVHDEQLTARSSLIRLADMLSSQHLVEDCLAKGVYKDAYTAYQVAFEALSQLDLDPDDLELAQDLLTTLFLWYLTFLEQPRRLSLSDLVEATLTTEGVLRSDDNVELVLTSMQALPQVDVSERSAVFVPAGSETGPQVLNLFQEQKRQALRDQHKVRKSLAESLFWNPRSTGGVKGLFADYTPDATKAHQVRSRNLEYPGELVIASTWRLDHGLALNSSSETHFRLVILTPDAAHTVQAHDLQDARIAVVVPGEMSEETRTAVVEYVAWHNLEQEYSAQVGRDAEDVRSWLDSRKQTIVNQVATTHLQVYQSGRILTRDNLGISASEIFGQGGDNDVRIAAIVDRLLQAVYRQVPVATDSFRSALTANETGKVFEGYFNPKATTAQTTATKNYGVGLGLSAADKPSHFAPQAPPVFTLIESMLADRAGRDLPVWQIVDRLAAPPYGLPYVVIQLYLLAFVRRGTPRVDLTLKVRHTLKLRTGQPVTRDRLTASSVVDLDWKAGLHDKFDALVPSSGPIWNDTLAYAREMTDRLTATTDQVDIEQQTQELIKALRELKEHLVRQRESLKVLAETLHMPLPATASADLDRLAQLTADLPDGYADFHERAETIFADSPEQLRASMQTFQRVRDLTDYAAAINQAHSYLTAVALRPGDTGLAAERNDVLSQLTLPLLVEQPEIWPQRLRHAFDSFKTHYRNAYQKHHRDYYETMTSLTNRLADARNRRDVLTLLNQIEGIGGAVGDDLERRWKAVEDVLRLCSIRDVLAVNVDASPVCAVCGLRLTDSPPEDRVRDLLRDLDMALTQKQRQLASQPVTQVLHDTGLHDLAEAAAAPDLTRLIEIVTPDLIELAKLAMEEAQIYTVDAPVLADIRQTYPTIAEADISQVVADFETRLRDAFRRAGKPGKKNIRITLH